MSARASYNARLAKCRDQRAANTRKSLQRLITRHGRDWNRFQCVIDDNGGPESHHDLWRELMGKS